VLFLAYAAYFVVLLRSEEVPLASIDGDALQKVWRTVLGVGGGLGLVVFSAQLVVTQAVLLASNWEVSQTLIGIFLVGIGTSLPELALSVRAALRGQASLSVGNVIGSNTFDLLVPVGASALIHPLAVEQNAVRFDLPAMAVITICTMVFFLSRKGLPKWAAATLLVLYGTYLGLRVWVV